MHGASLTRVHVYGDEYRKIRHVNMTGFLLSEPEMDLNVKIIIYFKIRTGRRIK